VIRSAGAVVAAVDELEHQVLGSLDVVIEQLDQALESIGRHDARLAREVLAGDEQIVKECVLVHQCVLSLLAAKMLRGIVRIEAECVKVADVAMVWISEERGDAALLGPIERVGRLSLAEVLLAKQAFAWRRVDLAHRAARVDGDLRALNRQVLGQAVEVRGGWEVRDRAMFLFLVACRLERIGDNALDIAEQTVIVDGGLFGEVAGIQPARSDRIRESGDEFPWVTDPLRMCAPRPRLVPTPPPSLARLPRKRDFADI
jgi:phosphate uptake regulator